MTRHFYEKKFSDKVVEAALSIPKGRVTSYGRLAAAAGGGPMATQSVTGILARAYDRGQKNIPFHRIVYADGRIWTSPTYDAERKKLYKKEGIELDEKNRIKNFADKVFEF